MSNKRCGVPHSPDFEFLNFEEKFATPMSWLRKMGFCVYVRDGSGTNLLCRVRLGVILRQLRLNRKAWLAKQHAKCGSKVR